MVCTSKGKIFPAAERGHTETQGFRSFTTFNFGHYQHEHKKPFGPLYVLNDETLAGGGSIRLAVEEDTLVLLLPLVGCIETTGKKGEQLYIEAGQVQLLFQQAGSEVNIRNPYDEELVNYLQVWIRYSSSQKRPGNTFSFNIDCRKSKLVQLFPTIQEEGFFLNAVIGKLGGREEAVYQLSSAENAVMAFVIQGALELENRLLENRDGLVLWNTTQIEMEALSNDAIVLLLELKKRIKSD